MQQGLFETKSPVEIVDCGGLVNYYPDFLDHNQSDYLFQWLLDNTEWQRHHIRIGGSVSRPIPRLTAWHGDQGAHYRYSGISMKVNPWPMVLFKLKLKLESYLNQQPENSSNPVEFNSVLLNLYRDGNDSVAWHSDNERELGSKPFIASISVGAPREFQLKPHDGFTIVQDRSPIKLTLQSGSLLTMGGSTQQNWLHSIPKCKESCPRINLTFRKVHVPGR